METYKINNEESQNSNEQGENKSKGNTVKAAVISGVAGVAVGAVATSMTTGVPSEPEEEEIAEATPAGSVHHQHTESEVEETEQEPVVEPVDPDEVMIEEVEDQEVNAEDVLVEEVSKVQSEAVEYVPFANGDKMESVEDVIALPDPSVELASTDNEVDVICGETIEPQNEGEVLLADADDMSTNIDPAPQSDDMLMV
ncbi:MAG: hypothetical protein ACI4SO_07825 [Muribaculaceae bacterium]